MRSFWSLLGIVVSLHVCGQNMAVLDSMKRALPAASPAKQFVLLNAIGFEYRYSFPDSTIFYCNKAFEIGTQLKIKKELSKPLSFIGLAYANKGDYKGSLDFHYRSIEVAIQQNDSVQLGFAYNNLGRMFQDQGDVLRAYDNLMRSKALFEIVKDKSGLAYVYRSLSHVFKSQKEFTQALEMSSRALELRRELGRPRDLASAYMEIGLIYEEMELPRLALQNLKIADSIADLVHDKVTKAEIGLGIAELLIEGGKYEEAYKAATTVLDAVSASTNRKIFIRASLVAARYYVHNGEDRKAIPLLDVIVGFENQGTPYFQRDATYMLHTIYKARNDLLHASEYLSRYNILNERLQNQDLTNQVEKLQFLLEIEKKERENEVLKASQLRNESLIEKQHFQNSLLVITLICIAGLAVIMYTSNRRRRLINEKLALQNAQINQQREEISNQNESLSKRNQQLSSLNNEKDTLMNIVAHDLKAPLNRIAGLSQLMEMTGVPESLQEFFRRIKDSTRAGLELIVDLLDVNALDESRREPTFEPVSIGELMSDKVKSFGILAEAKKITVVFRNDVEGTVTTDPTYVSRILDNLISNAIKFSPNSSFVSISCELQKGQIMIRIKDQGPGFSEDDKRQMFQKFTKLSARPTGGESSNGLGLAIVKKLIERLGGEITLKSIRGEGSEFTIMIPDKTPVEV